MARYNDTALIVDDGDSSIQYSGAWQHLPPIPGAVEYMLTKSGAGPAGLTATFKFTGSGVEVYGSQGSWDVYGVPVTTYTIDGELAATYHTPIIASPFFTDHTLFFRSAALTPGEHQLVITTTNGTSPNMYWLDYIIYSASATPAPPPSQPQPQSQSQSPSQSPSPTSQSQPSQASQQPSQISTQAPQPSVPTSPAPQSPTSSPSAGSSSSSSRATAEVVVTSNGTVVTVTPLTAAPSSSDTAPLAAAASSSSHIQAGPIAGGVVGGVILLTALILLFFFLHRRRERKVRSDHDVSPDINQIETADGAIRGHGAIVPFGSWRTDNGGRSVPSEKRVLSPLPTASQTDPFSDPGTTFIPSSGSSSDPSPEPYAVVPSNPPFRPKRREKTSSEKNRSQGSTQRAQSPATNLTSPSQDSSVTPLTSPPLLIPRRVCLHSPKAA